VHGDLGVHVMVKVPEKRTKEQRALFEQLLPTLPENNEPTEKGLLDQVKDYFRQ
jgi:DnaJ-class molecular chaperone